MKNYKKITFSCGSSIEDAVNELLEYKEKGILACGEFNGKKLKSDTVTMDSAYIVITGKTKKECDEAYEKHMQDIKRKNEEHEKKIPELTKYWIEEGKKIIKGNSRIDKWISCVPIRLNDLYKGMELEMCLKILKILDNGTFEEAKEEINNQGHSGMSYGLMCSMIREFHEKGESFVKYLNNK